MAKFDYLENFQFLNLLDYGFQGQVFLAQDKQNNELVAIKIIDKKKIINQGKLNQMEEEQQILQFARHENIVQLKYTYENDQKIFQIFEFCQGGNLYNLMKSLKKISEQQAAEYAYQILNAIEFLHSKDIIHRDIKPDNILLTQNGQLKLTDFGLSMIGKSGYQQLGTWEYIPPEILQKKQYDNSIDLWSFGITIYEMVVGQTPFYDREISKLKNKILYLQPQFPDDVSKEFKDLIQNLLQKDPEKRLGKKDIQDIKNHNWFEINQNVHNDYNLLKLNFDDKYDLKNFNKSYTTKKILYLNQEILIIDQNDQVKQQ